MARIMAKRKTTARKPQLYQLPESLELDPDIQKELVGKSGTEITAMIAHEMSFLPDEDMRALQDVLRMRFDSDITYESIAKGQKRLTPGSRYNPVARKMQSATHHMKRAYNFIMHTAHVSQEEVNANLRTAVKGAITKGDFRTVVEGAKAQGNSIGMFDNAKPAVKVAIAIIGNDLRGTLLSQGAVKEKEVEAESVEYVEVETDAER